MSLVPTKKCSRINKTISISNDHLEISVLPDFGGKITSIRNLKTNTEFLTQSSIPIDKMKKPENGACFLPPYTFGFDDCFPNIAPIELQKNGISVAFPDHGQIWTSKMGCVSNEHEIILDYKSVEDGYKFTKRVTIHNSTVRLHYTLKNESSMDFRYLWSAHPLLQIDEGDKILLPNSVSYVDVYYASDNVIAEGEDQQWPLSFIGDKLIRVLPKESDFASKLFVRNIPKGVAGLYRIEYDETILFKFDKENLPHLGLWLCYNGWPQESKARDYAIAIEPTTTASDKICDSHLQKGVKTLASGKEFKWIMDISIQQGKVIL